VTWDRLPEEQGCSVWRYLGVEFLLVGDEVELWLLLLILTWSSSASADLSQAWHAALCVVLSKTTWRELEGLLVLAVGIGVLIDSVG